MHASAFIFLGYWKTMLIFVLLIGLIWASYAMCWVAVTLLFSSCSCGSCGYDLNLNSSSRNTSTIGSKYGKSIKKGIISFFSIDESRFNQVEEFSCLPNFIAKHSWGFFRQRTKLLCRKCGNLIGVASDLNNASSIHLITDGSESPSSSEISSKRKYDIRIRSLQPSSTGFGTPLVLWLLRDASLLHMYGHCKLMIEPNATRWRDHAGSLAPHNPWWYIFFFIASRKQRSDGCTEILFSVPSLCFPSWSLFICAGETKYSIDCQCVQNYEPALDEQMWKLCWWLECSDLLICCCRWTCCELASIIGMFLS